MAWGIEFDAGALGGLRRIDRQVARRITLFPRDRIGVPVDPCRFGAPVCRATESLESESPDGVKWRDVP